MPRMSDRKQQELVDRVEHALASRHPHLPLLGELGDGEVSAADGFREGIFRGRNGGGHGDRYVGARLGDGTWLSVVCDPARAGNAGLDPSATWNATVAVGWPVPDGTEADDDGFAEEVLLGYASLARLVADAMDAIVELTLREGASPRP